MIGIPSYGIDIEELSSLINGLKLNSYYDVHIFFNFKDRLHYDNDLIKIQEFESKYPEVITHKLNTSYGDGLLRTRRCIIEYFTMTEYEYLLNFDADDTLNIPDELYNTLGAGFCDTNYPILAKYNYELLNHKDDSDKFMYSRENFSIDNTSDFLKYDKKFLPGIAFSVMNKCLARMIISFIQFNFDSLPVMNLCEDVVFTLIALDFKCVYVVYGSISLGVYNNESVSTTFSSDAMSDYNKVSYSTSFIFGDLESRLHNIDCKWLSYYECCVKSYLYYVVKKKFEGINIQ